MHAEQSRVDIDEALAVPGEHLPIIDQQLWDRAQAMIAVTPQRRATHSRAKVPFLLKGLLFDADGRALQPWQSRKQNGRLYRYYLSTRELKEHAGVSGLPRLPAEQLEAIVVDQLRQILRAPSFVLPITIAQRSSHKQVVGPIATRRDMTPLKLTPFQLALVRGHQWLAQLESGEATSLKGIAESEGIDRSLVSRLINLTALAPDIVQAILDDTLPESVTLLDVAIDAPLDWNQQRATTGQVSRVSCESSP